MRPIVLVIACVLLSACEWDARKENMALTQENEELRLQLHLSTEYIEDVTEIIDQVQRNLQRIRDREGVIDRISLGSEGTNGRAVNVRREIVTSISDIDSYILENREKMELLAQRVQDSQIRIGSLEQLVENLAVTVKQKERDIVQLKKQISVLQADVADLQGQIVVKDQEIQSQTERIEQQALTIEQREAVIRAQEEAAATAFFVAKSRDELMNEGLIVERRTGFLGLSRKMHVGTISESRFRPVEKAAGKIEFGPGVTEIEIVSAHKDRPDLYTFERTDRGSSLNITDTDGFWALSEYLIIVVSE